MQKKILPHFFLLLFTSIVSQSCTHLGPDFAADHRVSPSATQAWIPTRKQDVALLSSTVAQSTAKQTPHLPILQSGAKISLAELISIGLGQNPSTRQAWESARTAAYGLASAKSSCYPTINLTTTLSASDQIPSKSTSPRYARTLEPEVALDYLLLDFGERSASVMSAQQALFAANWAHNQAIQDVLLQILQAYYTYASTQAALTAKQEDLNDAQSNLEATQQQYQAGLLMHTDLLQMQANFTKAQLDVETAQSSNKVQFCTLVSALGLPANLSFEIEPLPEHFPLQRDALLDVEQLLALAMQHRSDLAQAQATFMQKKADFQKAKSAGLPTLSANATASKTRYMGHVQPTAHDYTAGIGLNIPLFDGFLTKSNCEQAKSLASAAYADLEMKQTSIYLDVISSYTSLQTAIESLKYSQLYLKYASELYRSVFIGYKQGLKAILDLLAAQSSLADARAEYIQARTNAFASLASLSYSLGMLNPTVAKEGAFDSILSKETHNKWAEK